MGQVAPASILTGFRPVGVDGLVVVVTLLVVATTIVAVRGQAPPERKPADAGLGLPPLPAGLGQAGSVAASAAPAFRGLFPRVPAILAHRKGAAVVLSGGLLLVLAGQRSFARTEASSLGFAVWFAGLVLLVALERLAPTLFAEGGRPAAALGAPALAARRSGGLHPGFLLASLGGAIVVWTAQRGRPLDAGHWDIVAGWLATVAAGVLAVWRPARGGVGVRARLAAHRTDLIVGGVMTAAAAVPQFIRLDSYPAVFNGDEGVFALSARAVLRGTTTNPFGTGIQVHPTLFFFLQAGWLKIVGETVVGARVLSALFATAAVPATYLLVRRHFGRATAVVAAVLLASFHVHIFWGREAQNNSASTFFVVIALYLLDRALADPARLWGMLAGLAVGFAQYFYVGDRLLLPVTLACVLAEAVGGDRRGGSRWRAAAALGRRCWPIVVGFAVAVAPLYAHYFDHRAEYTTRIDLVSVFKNGWLDQEAARTGRSVPGVLWRQFAQAAMLPFCTPPAGAYRGNPPFVGWPLAITGAVGLAVAMSRCRHRRFFGLVVTYWGAVAALALTVGPETNRFVITTPLLCIFAALGIVTVARLATALLRMPAAVAAVAAAAVVVVAAAWSLSYYFHDPNQIDLYSDINTQAADRLARDVLRLDPKATVYFAGPPRMWYDGFPNIRFRAPEAHGMSIERPWGPTSTRPAITGTTLFVFLPEREAELAQVRRWFPNGTVSRAATDRGEPLFTEYRVAPAASEIKGTPTNRP